MHYNFLAFRVMPLLDHTPHEGMAVSVLITIVTCLRAATNYVGVPGIQGSARHIVVLNKYLLSGSMNESAPSFQSARKISKTGNVKKIHSSGKRDISHC